VYEIISILFSCHAYIDQRVATKWSVSWEADASTVTVIESGNQAGQDFLGTELLRKVVDLIPEFADGDGGTTTSRQTRPAGLALRGQTRGLPEKVVLFVGVLEGDVLKELESVDERVGEVFTRGDHLCWFRSALGGGHQTTVLLRQ
jgi:hypothetical protein